MSPSSDLTESPACFEPSPFGYIRHWLVAGPHETLYAGPSGPDHVLRKQALDYSTAVPPAPAMLGEPGPFDLPWKFHDPGRNEFVEFSTFYQRLTLVECYAFTEVVAPAAEELAARLWAAGAADLWVNDEHVARLNVTRYRNPDCQSVTLPLRAGANRLSVRLQCLGIRDTRLLFGLSLENPAGISVRVARAGRIAQALDWIDGIRAPRCDRLESKIPAPFDAQVVLSETQRPLWPAGSSEFSFGQDRPVSMAVESAVDGIILTRQLEIPSNRPPAHPPQRVRRTAHLENVAKAGVGNEPPASWNGVILTLLARRLLGQSMESDAEIFARSVRIVDERSDCADFVLSGLLRMEHLALCSPAESREIRRAALAFRYWDDEPGNDAMCFRSENHTLLFHGCQLLAGRLYPDEAFLNSGRQGKEQAPLALERIEKWLEIIEQRGFEEFNSGTYIPITIGAMLNVVDFSEAPELASRMSAQIDRIFRDLAHHAFGGGVISPQGRAYRDVLLPERSGTQVLLAFATDAMESAIYASRAPREPIGDWVAFLASSPRYSPPKDLGDLVTAPVSRVYRHANVQIVLEKTPAYLLTSLAVPAIPRKGEHPNNDLRPGGAGYQQHLWQATLGRDCHVFVNHPGGFFDGTKSRPGYWYGSGLLPRVRQEKNWLQAIHVIADGTKTKPEITPEVWEWGSVSTVRPFDLHPISFTHAHWPSDSFQREERAGNWVFGQKARGLIGLWCSEPLVPHDDILTGRELRAHGYASAWLVICGDLDQEGSLEAFMQTCQAREPEFDRAACTLSMKNESTTKWWERSEPMPS